MSEVRIRALQPDDAGAARAVVSVQLAGTLYETRVLEQLDVAIGGNDAECRGIVAFEAREAVVVGLVLFGIVAGARGVVKVHALLGNDRVALRALATAVCNADVRMVVCEIADEPRFGVTVQLLRELGYTEEGRVADFIRDGVALLRLTWRHS
jgi:hypothetical protein